MAEGALMIGPATGTSSNRRTGARAKRVLAVLAAVALAFVGLSVANPGSRGAKAEAASCPWVGSTAPVSQRVEQVMAAMSQSQELELVYGASGSYQGNIPAIPALCIPSINLQDGPQGVGDGLSGVTQLPAPVAAAASWDTSVEQQYGSVVGSEFAGKGANLDFGPTINIVRDPRWGRAFESFSEDPYLAGQMAAAYIQGVQGQGVMAQVKHYAVYNNETNRNNSSDDDVVSERAMQELYMPAFQAAINAGSDSVMCAYSWPNDSPACQNDYLLGDLDNELGFQGFVGSDYEATQSTAPSIEAGNDMDQPGSDNYFGSDLSSAIGTSVPRDYLDDAVERILIELFDSGVMNTGNTGSTGATVSTAAHVSTALQVAEEGTVLLKNSGSLLPLSASSVGSIAVIGTNANPGLSDQDCAYGSPQNNYPYSGGGSACVNASTTPVSPLAGIQAAAPGATVTYNAGSSQSSAVAAAQAAKVAIVFAGYDETEGADLSSIDLGTTEDNLISAVGAANPDTIVVLNSGSAVTMPWLSSIASVIESWYPGQEDGTALANILFGSYDPSGHLPVTFPTSLSQVPASTAAEFPGANGQVQYNEGVDVGYRWYQAKDQTPLFPFGYGLSYTTFSFSGLSVSGFSSAGVATVTATVTNTGSRAGADVAQLYIGDPSSTGEPPWQLKDFQRVSLNAGASTTVTFSVPVHDLTYWAGPGASTDPTAWSGPDPDGGGWTAPAGTYAIGVGDSSASLPLTGSLTLASAVGPDTVTVTSPGNQSTAVAATVNLQLSAADSAVGQTLSYTATGLPGGLSINPSTGDITGTALYQESDVVTVTATDTEGYENSVSFEWVVGGTATSCGASGTGESELSESGFTASTSAPSDTTDTAQNAITNAVNDTSVTRFSSDEDQATGLTYEVNMGSAKTFNEIEMASPGSPTDYATGYEIQVSSNGSTWTTVATCGGIGSPDIASFPSQTAQYVQVVLTAADTSYWWSINQFLIMASSSSSSSPEAPFGGTAAAVPGTVQAANYDTGGQGVAYNVTSVNGTANTYRSDGVDLEATTDTQDTTGTGAGYDLGWTASGQSFRYTVNVATAGTYTLSLRLASLDGVTDALHIASASGTNLSGDVNAPDTGGWQDWATVTASVTLPAGTQTLVVDQDNPGWNIHFMSFASAASGINTSDWYEVVNENSGLCASATGSGTANGTAVEQLACTGSTSQLWQFVPVVTGYYEVLNDNAQSEGESWNIAGGVGATASGDLLQTWDYGGTGNTNELFAADLESSGYYNFVADNSSLCIDTPGASITSGVQLQQYTCNSTSAQEFSLVPG
jgi:beta-glucosidase